MKKCTGRNHYSLRWQPRSSLAVACSFGGSVARERCLRIAGILESFHRAEQDEVRAFFLLTPSFLAVAPLARGRQNIPPNLFLGHGFQFVKFW